MAQQQERWNSRLGVILAVSGSAVGLGNFLRFPGQAAQYGGGAFMLAYFISFLLLGLPICWAEWAMGRRGGAMGFNATPGILAAITGRPWLKWMGTLGVVIPVIIYMYYACIEAWCLGYAVNFISGNMHFSSIDEAGSFWSSFIGIGGDGEGIGFGTQKVGTYLLLVFGLNFLLIYRGLSKGIEWFCTYAMPTLVVIAVIVLIRVLTLSPVDPINMPENNISNGLGFMWNPTQVELQEMNSQGKWEPIARSFNVDVLNTLVAPDPQKIEIRRIVEISLWQQLLNPQLWLAAAGQIFFSLSVGFGLIMTYASYLSEKDDVVLSALSATSANEFCEVVFGGLITLPAAFVFLGASGLAGAGLGTFSLGFKVLPMVFSAMPMGWLFGFLFFFLLFLAAITSSLSMLQPGIAFLEESLHIRRKKSVTYLGLLTLLGSSFVLWFSKDVKALDTLDFWAGTFLIYLLATITIVCFSWVIGVDKGLAMAQAGSVIQIPRLFRWIMKYVTPLFLVFVFVNWLLVNAFNIGGQLPDYHIVDLFGFGTEPGNPVARLSAGVILITMICAGWVLIRSKSSTSPKP
jgi:SNF family Na+-dependent transporter